MDMKKSNFNEALGCLYQDYPIFVSLLRFCVCFTLFVFGKVLLSWLDGRDALSVVDLLLQPVAFSVVFVVLFSLLSKLKK